MERLENLHNDPGNFDGGEAPEPTDFAAEYERRSNTPDALAGGASPAQRAAAPSQGDSPATGEGDQGRYANLKRAELQRLAKERDLPAGGKNDDIIAELEAADAGEAADAEAAGQNPPAETGQAPADAGTDPAETGGDEPDDGNDQ